jgi:DNA-binding CsgD family transcriptional regulator/N-acetylneuraminic acid mutarotase
MANEHVALSERELEVLALVATGLSNQEIAHRLVISVNTVKVHVRSILDKLGVQSRTEATLVAIRTGLVTVPGTQAATPAREAEPLVMRAPPVAWWQRLTMVGALVLSLSLLVLPELPRDGRALEAANPISDRPGISAASVYVPTSRWIEHADLPSPRTRLALVAHRGQMYAIGGDRDSGVTGQVEAYSPATDTWSTRAAKPDPASNISGVVVGDRIFVPGGCTSTTGVIDRLGVYDPTRDSWAQGAPMPVAACGYALAVLDGMVYVLGGWDGHAFMSQVQVYDPAQDVWGTRAALPSPRGFAAAGTIGSTIYVVGGYDGARELADVLAYDAGQNRWSPRMPMSTGRAGLGAAVVNNELYAIGGGWVNYLATSEKYNPNTDTWSVFESPMLGQWRNLGVAALDTEVYAVGGWNGDYMRVNRAYRALFRITLPVVESSE